MGCSAELWATYLWLNIRLSFGPVSSRSKPLHLQKRGLPHLHFLGILAAEDRLDTPEKIDAAISAEIPPDPLSYPPGPAREQAQRLEAAVLLFMVHGPCGDVNPSSPCMKKSKSCDKFYPKPFSAVTIVDEEKNRPVYMRRSPAQGGRQVKIMRGGKEYLIDNSNIVPHNRFLLLRFASHINVEICTSCGGEMGQNDDDYIADNPGVKYLTGYLHKGCDRCMVQAQVKNLFE